ncbi:MAG: hypothetical protein Q8Q89_02550 [bacterium]|nr:hypothetical protein [bacterium]
MKEKTKFLLLSFLLCLLTISLIPACILGGVYIIHWERTYCDNHLFMYILAFLLMGHSWSFLKLSLEGFNLFKKVYNSN